MFERGDIKVGVNDQAWNDAFEYFRILDKIETLGFADVTAGELKKFREPRLMAKIDHSKDLPAIFQDYGLSILPISRSAYRIGPFRIFQPLVGEDVGQTTVFPFPEHITTLDFTNMTTEPELLHAAFVSGILNDFSGEDLQLTTSGRMGSGEFDFDVARYDGGATRVQVRNAQIEIDGGYEGGSSLFLIEAKNHLATDFNIRQLYYPFRTWSSRISKPVKACFLMSGNGEYELHEYQFEDRESFSTPVCTKTRRYSLSASRVTTEQLKAFALIGIDAPPKLDTPFPQADNFQRVIDLVRILLDGDRTLESITEIYSFDKRQSKYYLDAAVYLGLAKSSGRQRRGTNLAATSLASDLFELSRSERDAGLAKLILSRDSFARAFLESIRNSRGLSNDALYDSLAKSEDLANYSEVTVKRRIGTIRAWVKWIQTLAN